MQPKKIGFLDKSVEDKSSVDTSDVDDLEWMSINLDLSHLGRNWVDSIIGSQLTRFPFGTATPDGRFDCADQRRLSLAITVREGRD